MRKLIKSAILILVTMVTIGITNYVTLQNAKIQAVNEKDNIILIKSFNQKWVFEY